jgi:3-phenylpropionate/trans-cinnamate dioxygenase ferredoxin reductase subunit
MNSSDSLLIVGASHAGGELALTSRQLGWTGPITLLGDEALLPYQRPPLSKAYLSGAVSSEALLIRPPAAYESAGLTLRLGARAKRIDRSSHNLLLTDGSILTYSKLALCTGGRARQLNVEGLTPGVKPINLHYLRTQMDVEAIRSGLVPGAKLVIIGGGYIGLEVGASARKLGAFVTVIEAQPRVLARVTGPELSAFYESVHREAGAVIRTGVTVQRIECADNGAVQAVVCGDGSRVDADLVVVGVGMLPNVELAMDADLKVDGGIVVDEFSVTSDPDIFAAGDCTVHDSALFGRRVRLESVPNALEQARAAASMLCGKPKPNHSVPWFWSDQFDLKLQMVGLSEGYDRCVVRGDVASRSFIAFYLRQGKLIAADAVNRPADFMMSKRLVAASAHLSELTIADESIPLKTLFPQ